MGRIFTREYLISISYVYVYFITFKCLFNTCIPISPWHVFSQLDESENEIIYLKEKSALSIINMKET